MAVPFTLGIEEEFQIVDPTTRELRAHITQLIEANTPLDEVNLMAELHESVVEVATGVCTDIRDARRQVLANRRKVARIAERVGMSIAAASTHPFSRWQDQPISDKQRYLKVLDELQDVARANLIFGLHVHVGMPDRREAIAVFNMARYFLPHLLALSGSSPFLEGRDTGLKSARSLVFERLPRTGIPERFDGYSDFVEYVDTLVATGCIDDGSRIWWDLRPHPRHDTLEFRICDIPTNVEHTITIAALVQAIVARLTMLYRNNMSWGVHRTAFIRENKWRALRYGIDGRLIDFGRRAEAPFVDLADELLDFVEPVVDELGSRWAIEGVHDILAAGTSADQQRRVYEKSGGDFHAVVDWVIAETLRGVPDDATIERDAAMGHA